MHFRIPTYEEMPICLSAMMTMARAKGPLGEGELAMFRAMQHAAGTSFSLDSLSEVSPVVVKNALVDSRLHEQLLNAMTVLTLIEGHPHPKQIALLEQFAATFGLPRDNIRVVRDFGAERALMLRIDLLRRFWVVRKLKGEVLPAKGLTGVLKEIATLAGRYEDPHLTQRYKALATYPAGSLGRTYVEFLEANGFPFPGEPYAGPELMVIHDCTHILSGYGTDPLGEVQVAAFSAGHAKQDPFSFILFALIQFHLGIRLTPVAQPEHGVFDPAKVLPALQRGAAMTVDLTDNWQPLSVMERSVSELQQEYGIPAL